MNATQLETKFTAMGARFKLKSGSANRWRPDSEYAIDIQHDEQGEFFELRVSEAIKNTVHPEVMQVKPRDRHLLLLVRRTGEQEQLDRFLCGHDERSWFVAAVPGGASSVRQAMDALKPPTVLHSLVQNRVGNGDRNRRRNRAFRRQGEWFFVPAPGLRVNPLFVLRNEPIRRGGGKAHFVEYLYRTGGEKVYVSEQHPNGLTQRQYEKLLARSPSMRGLNWRSMMRNPEVYARGKIRHPDHCTILLPDWHQVLMNTESQAPSLRNMAFLD